MAVVALIPGFLASNLNVVSSGEQIWFNTLQALTLGVGGLRLAPDGITPGAPDGVQCMFSTEQQDPWPDIITQLRQQLVDTSFTVQFIPYDWRLDLTIAAVKLAADIELNFSPSKPVTLVCHSAGGLVASLAYGIVNRNGNAANVRRLITIGTPFQGSYTPIQWLTGILPSVQQLIALSQIGGIGATIRPQFFLDFLNALALTWPAFYQLFPSLLGSSAVNDPLRPRLFDAGNYAPPLAPQQAWLNQSKNFFQALVADPTTIPPSWVLTTVAGFGLNTPERLLSARVPLALSQLGGTYGGDGIVTVESAHRGVGAEYDVVCNHASLPLGITRSGLLASLITDPRGPPSPSPPLVTVGVPVGMNVTDPPESAFCAGMTCIGGG